MAAGILLLAALCTPATLAQDGAGTAVSSGVYTAEQAERGAALFARSCAGCHGAELGGGMGPTLAPLGAWWQGSSLASLGDFVRRNMPMTAPGSLPMAEYGDIVAFILASNGYPAGEAELSLEAEGLAEVLIDAPPAQP